MYPFNNVHYFSPTSVVRTFLSIGIVWLVGFFSYGFSSIELGRLDFKEVTNQSGSSIDSVRAIFQDSKGYIYLGAQTGLYIFDGYKYIRYEHDDSDPNSISANWVTSIHEDQSGTIWVGTKNGLNVFNRRSGDFKRFLHVEEDESTLLHNNIKSVCEGPNGTVWVGTHFGACEFDSESQSFRRYKHVVNPEVGNDNQLTCLYVDRFGLVWIGTNDNGVYCLNVDANEFEQYSYDAGDSNSLTSNAITSIVGDDLGRLWVGTQEEPLGKLKGVMGGVNLYDRLKNNFDRYSLVVPGKDGWLRNASSLYIDHDDFLWIGVASGDLFRLNPKDNSIVCFPDKKLSGTYVTSILEDRFGEIWVGLEYDALKKSSRLSENYLSWEAGDASGLSGAHVVAVYEDFEENLWIGTISGGLNRYDFATEEFTYYRGSPEDDECLPLDRISALYEDRRSNFWVGTYKGGLSLFDRDSGKALEHYYYDLESELGLSNNRIRVMYEDSRGSLWIGHYAGLEEFDRDAKTFDLVQYLHVDGVLAPHDAVMDLLEDRLGRLWIGSDSGVSVMDLESRKIIKEYNDLGAGGLSSLLVRALLEDSGGDIWIGTRNGLNRLDVTTGSIVQYSIRDGLASNVIFGIEEDERGMLWISTDSGLSRLDPDEGVVHNYGKEEGLLNGGFELKSSFKNQYGRMYFGGKGGLDSFYPKDIGTEVEVSSIVISAIKKYDKDILRWSEFDEIDEIRVLSSDSYLSFEFSMLDFVNPFKSRYMHILEGFDDDWIYDETRHYANYTNLPPGEYVFRVKGANSRGVWSSLEATMKVVIVPMIWQRWWFQSVIAAFVLFLVLVIHRLVTFSIRKKNIELIKAKNETERANLTLEKTALEAASLAEEAKVASEAKSQFLANMSHEIRTPLNGVIGTLSLMRYVELNDELGEYVDIAEGSAQALLELLNDILDFSKIEAGHLNLESIDFDLEMVLKQVYENSKARSESKGLEFGYAMDDDVVSDLVGDSGRLRQVLLNLVTNAIKFTPSGSVRVKVSTSDQNSLEELVRLRFEVSDTGIGIESTKLEDVFAGFSQEDNSMTRKYGGTGLGLSISKQLVELMGGSIGVESEKGRGSTFWIEIPFQGRRNDLEKGSNASTETGRLRLDAVDLSSKTVLLVEDNSVNRDVAESILKSIGCRYYSVSDGQQAIDAVEQGTYDLVLMDCQMPGVDGLEATRVIRERESEGERIPIVAMTANVMQGDRDRCLEVGMDDYISKPFSVSVFIEKTRAWLGK